MATSSALAVGLVGYAVYFDYKRRNDVEFRKELRKQQKKAQSYRLKDSADQGSSSAVTKDVLLSALGRLKAEVLPPTIEGKEHYFMEQLAMGEQLSMRGADSHLAAALALYRALRVYPAPGELMQIYQKTIKADVLKVVMELIELDKQEEVGIDIQSTPPSEASSHDWEKLAASENQPRP